MDLQLDNSKDFIQDLYVESPDSSVQSTGSTLLNHIAGTEPESNNLDVCDTHQESEADPHPTHPNGNGDASKEILSSTVRNQNRQI